MFIQTSNIMQIQAFARMVRYRLDFVFAKIGFTLLQQLYHARKAWTALKIHEEKRLRPFRIRVHDVRLLVRSPDALDEENLDPPILSEPVSKRVGEISVGVYDARVRPGRHADGPDNRYVPIIISSHQYLFPGNCLLFIHSLQCPFDISHQYYRADQLLELLLHGHLESPEYNTSCYGKQPFTKGSLFLTICVHDIDSDRIERGEREIEGTRAHNLRQLYRVDAPLKLRKDLRAERISPSLLSYLGVPYPHPDPQNLEKIIDNYRVASFYIDNPYILIPRCSPSVSVTLTLSQVIAWPRAIAIGQSTQNLKRVLFLHKVSAWNQGLSPCNWTNLPEPDEGRRLLITLPDNISSENGGLRVTVSQDITKTAHSSSASSATFSPTRSKNRKSSISTLPKVSPKAPHSPTSKISSPKIFKSLTGSPSSNAPPHIPDTANDIFGGVITWSLLSITNENLNEGGYLLSIPRGSGDRGNLARREVWCVVVDRCFLSYLPIDSMKPRAYADLKHCYVTPMVDGIFRIDNEQAVSSSSSFKTLYFMGRNKQEGATWFRKLYTQSASNNTRKYSALDFLPGGVAAAFSILHIKGDEAGFNPRSFREDGDTTIRKMRTPGHRVTSLLASLRADPMLAFVYKAKEKDDFQDWDGSFDRSNQEPTRKLTINQMMKIKKARISDLVGRMKSFAGGDKEDTEEGSCWVGSDLAVAIATAVKTANRASSSSIVNITAMDGVDRRNKGTEATTIAAVTNESYPLKSSTLKGIRSSPCRPSNGLFLLFKSSKESKKGRQTIISLGDLSVGVRSEPVSKSRLARFNSMSCTPEERKKNFSAVGNT